MKIINLQTKSNIQQQGLTLIELIISITIMSISLTAIMSVFASSSLNSATPMIREQALSIASAYMEEVMLQPYTEPDTLTNTDTCEEGATNRALFDDVDDYSCINDTGGAIDQNGLPILGLEGYNIDVDITSDNLNGATAKRVDVNVSYDGTPGVNTSLTAYKLDY